MSKIKKTKKQHKQHPYTLQQQQHQQQQTATQPPIINLTDQQPILIDDLKEEFKTEKELKEMISMPVRPIGNTLWCAFRLGLDLTLDQVAFVTAALPWPTSSTTTVTPSIFPFSSSSSSSSSVASSSTGLEQKHSQGFSSGSGSGSSSSSSSSMQTLGHGVLPSLATSLESSSSSSYIHMEFELRIGSICWRKNKKRVHIGVAGSAILTHKWLNMCGFHSGVSKSTFDKIKVNLIELVKQQTIFKNTVTGQMENMTHQVIDSSDFKYGVSANCPFPIRCTLFPQSHKYIVMKKTRLKNILMSLRGTDIPSSDICISASHEQMIPETELKMSVDELKSLWNVKRVKHTDSFRLGCWDIILSQVKTTERHLSGSGSGSGSGSASTSSPNIITDSLEIELELVYLPHQIDMLNKNKNLIVQEWLHIGRCLAAI